MYSSYWCLVYESGPLVVQDGLLLSCSSKVLLEYDCRALMV